MGILSVLSLFLLLPPVQSAVVRPGSHVQARLESLVETGTSSRGDAIVAIVAEPVRAGSRIVVPEGSRLNGRVETIEPATNATEGRVRLVFREIEFSDGRKFSTWITSSFSASPPNRKLRYVLYTGLGGLAGGLIGGKAARTAGILGGVLGGFVIASNTADSKLPDLSLKPGKILRLEFREDLKVD